MPYSRERQESLARRIVAALKEDEGVIWEDDPETVRRRLNQLFAAADKAHAALEQKAEAKVAQLKRNVPPGSAEWDVLVRKNLLEEYDVIDHYAGL